MMKVLSVLLVAFVMVACGKDKKPASSGGSGNSGQNTSQETGGKTTSSVTALVEVPADIDVAERTIEILKSGEKTETKELSDGILQCTAIAHRGGFSYSVNGDTLNVVGAGGSDARSLSRISGTSGEVYGEWLVEEEVDNGIVGRVSMIVKSKSLTVKAVCRLAD